MSLKYVWHLTVPERQALTRIAKGRGGHHRPAMGKVKRARTRLKCDAGRGGTDEAISAAWDVSAGRGGGAGGANQAVADQFQVSMAESGGRHHNNLAQSGPKALRRRQILVVARFLALRSVSQ